MCYWYLRNNIDQELLLARGCRCREQVEEWNQHWETKSGNAQMEQKQISPRLCVPRKRTNPNRVVSGFDDGFAAPQV